MLFVTKIPKEWKKLAELIGKLLSIVGTCKTILNAGLWLNVTAKDEWESTADAILIVKLFDLVASALVSILINFKTLLRENTEYILTTMNI